MLKIGLVLSGGMAKGAYQMGALKAIKEFFYEDEIKAISSSSIGVINAFVFETDSVDNGISLWKNMMGGKKKIFITSVLKGEYLQESIRKLSAKNKKIAKPFFVTIFNSDEHELKYVDFSKEPESYYQKFLQASVALPVANKAVELNGKHLFDGAMVDNIPVRPLSELDLDLIICLYFEDTNIIFENEKFDSKIIKISFTNDSLVRDSICFEQKKIERMIEDGYSVTKENLDFYFSDGKENTEKVKEKIRIKNAEKSERKHRITGDFAVRKFNKLLQSFIKVEN